MRAVRAKCGTLNYAECEHILCLRGDVCKNIAANTWVVKDACPQGMLPEYYVLFHGTPIITFCPDGSVILRTGGYQTVTTKQRIWQFSGFDIFSLNFQWYVSGVGRFVEGMRITRNGQVDWIATLGIQDCPIDPREPQIAADWLEDHNRPEEAARLRAACQPNH